MKELIEKLLNEVDLDIKEEMLKVSSSGDKVWEWLQNPALTIIEWQRLRNEYPTSKKVSKSNSRKSCKR